MIKANNRSRQISLAVTTLQDRDSHHITVKINLPPLPPELTTTAVVTNLLSTLEEETGTAETT